MMKTRIYFGLLVFGLLWSWAPLMAQADNYFDQGKELYRAERYHDAIKRWEAVLSLNQQSSALYFNLGNAHYQLNELGPSIYYYEKALALTPNDRDVLANRGFVQNALIDVNQPMPKTLWAKWNEQVITLQTTKQWAIMAVLAMIGFVTLFLVYSWSMSSSWKRGFFALSMSCLVISMFGVLLAFKSDQFAAQDRWAIIFEPELILRSGPRASESVVFELHEGTKVKILSSEGNWHLIMSQDGREGWVLAESMREL
jgi:tetratricopeptide (TPR) repeat protein